MGSGRDVKNYFCDTGTYCNKLTAKIFLYALCCRIVKGDGDTGLSVYLIHSIPLVLSAVQVPLLSTLFIPSHLDSLLYRYLYCLPTFFIQSHVYCLLYWYFYCLPTFFIQYHLYCLLCRYFYCLPS